MTAKLSDIRVNGKLVSPISLTEGQFQREVIRIAEDNGWFWHHETDSRKAYSSEWSNGFPDLVLIRGLTMMFVELKTQGRKRRLSEAQKKWRGKIMTIADSCDHVNYFLWEPKDILFITVVLEGM